MRRSTSLQGCRERLAVMPVALVMSAANGVSSLLCTPGDISILRRQKLVAAVVDVETTGINPHSDRIIELGIGLFEYDRQNGRIYKVLGSWEWFEDPCFSIPSEITNITGITDEMVAGHCIDNRAVDDLLRLVVLVIAHSADFDRRFLEKRLPVFATKHWACSRADIDWKAEGIRSSALEFVAYSLGF